MRPDRRSHGRSRSQTLVSPRRWIYWAPLSYRSISAVAGADAAFARRLPAGPFAPFMRQEPSLLSAAWRPRSSTPRACFSSSSEPGTRLGGRAFSLIRRTGSQSGAGRSSTDPCISCQGAPKVHRSRAPDVHHRVTCRDKDWPPRLSPPAAEPFPRGFADMAAASSTMRSVPCAVRAAVGVLLQRGRVTDALRIAISPYSQCRVA
jgi:hypothetical protein